MLAAMDLLDGHGLAGGLESVRQEPGALMTSDAEELARRVSVIAGRWINELEDQQRVCGVCGESTQFRGPVTNGRGGFACGRCLPAGQRRGFIMPSQIPPLVFVREILLELSVAMEPAPDGSIPALSSLEDWRVAAGLDRSSLADLMADENSDALHLRDAIYCIEEGLTNDVSLSDALRISAYTGIPVADLSLPAPDLNLQHEPQALDI